MTKRDIIFLILWFNITCTFSAEIKKCADNNTKTPAGIVYWKYRGVRYTTSEDFLCWKENYKLFLRECNTSTGQWQPENVVCQEQKDTNKYCPEELVEIRKKNFKGDPLCLKISPEPQKYDEKFCYGSNVVPSDLSKDQLSNLKQFLQTRNIKEHWLPLRRENNTTPFKIKLPGKYWGQLVENRVDILDFTSDRNCMSAQYSRSNSENDKDEPWMIIKDCEALLHSICIFDRDLVTISGCPEGLGALSYRPNECYGVNWKEALREEMTEISIKEYFQFRNTLRQVLTIFIPETKRDKFFKVDSFVDNSNDKYLILMNQKEKVKISDQRFQILPVLYKKVQKIELSAVQLILKIDLALKELVLIAYNPKYLWRTHVFENGVNCFTNSDYEILRSTKIDLIWENKSKTKSIFKVKLVGDGPGEYWCEGHTIQDFQLVSTNRIVAVKKIRGHAFSIRMNLPCIIKTSNLCNNIYKNAKKMSKYIQEVLRARSKSVSRDLVIHNVRIMSIVNIDSNHVDCWIHLTASLLNSAVDNSDEESSEEDRKLETDESIGHETLIRKKVWMHLRNLISIYNSNNSNASIVRSTEYCFPDSIYSDKGEKYQWNQAVRGHMSTLSHLCLQHNGMPYMRQCQGHFIQGAYWEKLGEIVSCRHKQENSKLTKALYSLESSKTLSSSPEKVVRKLRTILNNYASQISPVDIDFSANILQSSLKYLDNNVKDLSTNITLSHSHDLIKNTTHDLISIYNYMVDVKKSTLKLSASLNSTNKMLEAFENALNSLSQVIFVNIGINGSVGTDSSDEKYTGEDFEVFDYEDIGVTLKASHNFLCFMINPEIANISGIAMFKDDNSTEQSYFLKGAFKTEYFRFLQSTHNINDFINETNLQFATYVPQQLLSRLDTISKRVNSSEKLQTIVVIKVYSNDKLFQPLVNQHQSAFGRVISISLPGHSTHLPEDLPLVFQVRNNAYFEDIFSAQSCSYWNFKNWVSDGIRVPNIPDINQNIILCQVSHLTPFAYLVGYNFTVEDDLGVSFGQVHDHALDIITLIGSSLSLLGISGIFITAAKFQSWRRKASSKVLLQLSASIALQMIILSLASTENFSVHLIINKIISSCVAIGAFLHYSVLVQFFWMMVIAYLQFKRYVQVFGRTRPTRFLIKSTAFCWGMPLIPVILVVLFDQNSFSKGRICYPSGYALYFGILLPISVIIIVNFIIFCLVIYNILLGSDPPLRHTEKPVLIYQIRLTILLFFLLGFTWCFGILTTMNAGIIFSYFFCITATLQGFVIFLYFIILDPVTRRMWGQYFYKLCSIDKGALQSTTSLRDTTQTS